MIFETHAHYFDEQFDEDRDDLLNNLNENGIGYVVEIADNIEHAKTVLDIANKYKDVYAAIGVHPESANETEIEDLIHIEDMLKDSNNKKVVAIGEIGLDYHYDGFDKEKQEKIFRAQLDIALKYNLPVVIHSRDASMDTMNILKDYFDSDLKGIMHCFAESVEMAKEYIKHNIYIGVGGVVTFKNAKKLVEVVKEIPLDMIVVETDCPYLSPEPLRGTRNDSRNIKHIIKKIAEIKGIDEKTVEDTTYLNAQKIYNIQ